MDDDYIRAMDYLGNHAHLIRTQKVYDAAVQLLMRVPEDWLQSRAAAPILFVQVVDIAVVWRLRGGIPTGSDLVLIDHRAAALSSPHLSAVLAHELGHIYIRDTTGEPTPQTDDGEIEADEKAAEWGFGPGLRSHLEQEVADGLLSGESLAQVRKRIAALT